MTDIDFGPLTALIGKWQGEEGMDVAPEPDGPDSNPYYEEIIFSPVQDDIENAEEQELVALHYRQIVRKKKNDKVFHDQTGYWIWNNEKLQVIHAFTIPRGISVLAAGSASLDENDDLIMTVNASADDPNWTIGESPFMQAKAKTDKFSQTLTVQQGKLSYQQTTVVDIYSHQKFQHVDMNTLVKVKT